MAAKRYQEQVVLDNGKHQVAWSNPRKTLRLSRRLRCFEQETTSKVSAIDSRLQ